MGIFIALLINIVITLFFYFKNPKEYVWYEIVLSLVITSALIFGAKVLADKHTAMFTEYWGETITEIYEEEPYNWWHSKQCSREYACGTDSDGNTTYCTEWYDCSEQEDEGPSWWCVTDLGNRFSMTEKYYDELQKLNGSPTRNKVKTRKNHSSRDKAYYSQGTKFEGTRVGRESYIWKSKWNGLEETRRGVYTKHRYENRIQAADLSLFNISVITEEDADTLGLFNYPEKFNKYTCPVFLGGDISEETQKRFRRLNAKFGPSNQFRLWILVFENQPMQRAIEQENYWVKGNKNELVLCVGVNDKKEIQWSHAFSWAKSSILTAEIKNKILDLHEYSIETTSGKKLPIGIPLNPEMKKGIQKMGFDTTMLPPVMPIQELSKKMGLEPQDIKTIVQSDKPMFTDKTLVELYDFMDANLHKFDRREFGEFYYLKVKPKPIHTVIVIILSVIVSILLNVWFSRNDTRQ